MTARCASKCQTGPVSEGTMRLCSRSAAQAPPQLGSDGEWTHLLQARGVAISNLRPSNCGFDVDWSEHFRSQFNGRPVKAVTASFVDDTGATHRKQGEFVVTSSGVEE